jgi:hypothetical protein
MSILAAIQWFWQRPASIGEVAGRACLYVLTLVATAWVIGTRNPFWPHDAWKLYVKVGSLLLAALAAVLTHFSLLMTITYGAPPDTSQPGYSAASEARTGLAYAVFVGCILLALVLVVGFLVHTATGARRETIETKAAARACSSFVAATAENSGLTLRPRALASADSQRPAPSGSPGQVHRLPLVGPRASFHGRLTQNPHAAPSGPGGTQHLLSEPSEASLLPQAPAASRSHRRMSRASRVAPDAVLLHTPQYGAAASAALRHLHATAEEQGATSRSLPHAQFAPLRVASGHLAGSAAAAAVSAGSAGGNRAAALLRGKARKGPAAAAAPSTGRTARSDRSTTDLRHRRSSNTSGSGTSSRHNIAGNSAAASRDAETDGDDKPPRGSHASLDRPSVAAALSDFTTAATHMAAGVAPQPTPQRRSIAAVSTTATH